MADLHDLLQYGGLLLVSLLTTIALIALCLAKRHADEAARDAPRTEEDVSGLAVIHEVEMHTVQQPDGHIEYCYKFDDKTRNEKAC